MIEFTSTLKILHLSFLFAISVDVALFSMPVFRDNNLFFFSSVMGFIFVSTFTFYKLVK